MYEILNNLRVIEVSSFIASPSAGLYLSQLGAEVIRVDMTGGGPDFNRWPISKNGASFYWEGLNKGKKSITINMSIDEGKDLIRQLVAAPGKTAGILLTNFPSAGFLSYENLKILREDVIVARVMGQANGGPAFDYTVNCALGYPLMTGPASLGDEPVNHVLPAWDLITGTYTAFCLLAAERRRHESGQGGEFNIPLADMGITTLANIGQLAEALYEDAPRPRYGNSVYGAFGRDFVTADGQRLMIMAITPRQWRALVTVLDISQEISDLETTRGVSFAKDEGMRFAHQDVLFPLIKASISKRQADELKAALDAVGGCWGLYQTMREAADNPTLVGNNPIFTELENPSGFTYPTPGSPLTLPNETRHKPYTAPRLGEHSREVLEDVLDYSEVQITGLIDAGIVGVYR